MTEFRINPSQDNPQKQLKPSKQQYYKEHSLKGSVARSVCPSVSQPMQQLLQYFKTYPYNLQYIDINKMHNSQFLKIKKYKQSIYYGEFINGKRHGQGVMVYNNGMPLSVIMGKNDNNQQQQQKDENVNHGKENYQILQIKFRIYEGQWQNDYKHGKGIEKFANGTLYEGNFLFIKGFYVNGKPQGVGRYAWPNGQFYEGQWLNGMKHGSGIWKGAKGDSYAGEWKFGKADGYGVHTWINGDRYEGQFKDCLKHGQGLQKFANGDIYKGFYSQGKPSGFGEYYWTNGSYFKGTFKMGLRNGHGIWKKGPGNSDKYEGEYLQDKKSGYGIFTWSSGNVYKGNYENDSRNGYGEMYWMDGSFYKGQWWNGIQHGKGEIYVPGQGVKKGLFQNNTLVSIQQEMNNFNQMPQNELLSREEKQFSHHHSNHHHQHSHHLNSGGSTSKTRQTFRTRAFSSATKKGKQQTGKGTNQSQARVFKLVDLRENHNHAINYKNNNARSNIQSRDSSFHSTITNRGGFIRFGGNQTDNNVRTKKLGNSRSIDSEGKKERILHSAFYMHKFHNEIEQQQNGSLSKNKGLRTSQVQRGNY